MKNPMPFERVFIEEYVGWNKINLAGGFKHYVHPYTPED